MRHIILAAFAAALLLTPSLADAKRQTFLDGGATIVVRKRTVGVQYDGLKCGVLYDSRGVIRPTSLARRIEEAAELGAAGTTNVVLEEDQRIIDSDPTIHALAKSCAVGVESSSRGKVFVTIVSVYEKRRELELTVAEALKLARHLKLAR